MKKLLLAAALSTAIIAPAAASAQDPATSKNAAKYCKELRDGAGKPNFVSMFGTKKNAYGKCVSQTAKAAAAAKVADETKADVSAAKTCKAERAQDAAAFKAKYGTNKNKSNAFGKCVSKTAKAQSSDDTSTDTQS